jgi:glycerol-3-phosphate acyltransferase PlsY
MSILALYIAAYLLGSIPVGVIVARSYGIDIQKIGSGNIGATNVQRALGPKVGVAVFLLDVLKGFLPAIAGRVMAPGHQEIWFLAGVFSIAGHCVSPFLGFRGGKGISTGLGAVLGAAPLTALSCFGLFIILLAVLRYMSLASMIAVTTSSLWGYVYADSVTVRIGYVVLTLFVIYRHRANIGRLRSGTEPRFTFKKTVQAGAEPEGAAPADSETSEPAGATDDNSEGPDGGEPMSSINPALGWEAKPCS